VPFTCSDCGTTFSLPNAVLQKYPNWTPRQCMDCRDRPAAPRPSANRAAPPARRAPSVTLTRDLTTEEVLARFTDGPTTGIFTDGSSRPNPGPGGWGAVFVRDNQVIEQRHGAEAWTTNIRRVLTALIAGLEMAPPAESLSVFTDSQLVANTLTKWAKGWEARGWKRKEGEIANLDLVQKAWALVCERPKARIEWIRAHDGSRWNEYADALSTAHLRSEV
jgi:ribonuclease HI